MSDNDVQVYEKTLVRFDGRTRVACASLCNRQFENDASTFVNDSLQMTS